jgi:hypothetical protein
MTLCKEIAYDQKINLHNICDLRSSSYAVISSTSSGTYTISKYNFKLIQKQKNACSGFAGCGNTGTIAFGAP